MQRKNSVLQKFTQQKEPQYYVTGNNADEEVILTITK